jgi:hypothetical protein
MGRPDMFGFKIITQWERGVVFRFGRALPGTRAPGLTWVNPVTDRLRKVNMQILVVAVPPGMPPGVVSEPMMRAPCQALTSARQAPRGLEMEGGSRGRTGGRR